MKGKKVKALIAGMTGPGIYIGRDYGSAPDIDNYIIIKSKRKLVSGRFYKVRITGIKGPDLTGVV